MRNRFLRRDEKDTEFLGEYELSHRERGYLAFEQEVHKTMKREHALIEQRWEEFGGSGGGGGGGTYDIEELKRKQMSIEDQERKKRGKAKKQSEGKKKAATNKKR